MSYYVFAGAVSDTGLKTKDGINVVIPSSGFEPERDLFAENLIHFMAQGRAWREGRSVEFWLPSAAGKVEGAVPILTSICEALDLAARWEERRRVRRGAIYDPMTQTLESGGRLLGFFSKDLFHHIQLTFCESSRRLKIDVSEDGRRASFRLWGLNSPELGHFVRKGSGWTREWPGLEKP